MTTEQFDESLRLASQGVNFGPLNGFGGRGSERVLANLPAPLQAVYRKWNIPTAILAGYAPGPCVRDYAGACGIDVAGDLAAAPPVALPITPQEVELAEAPLGPEPPRAEIDDALFGRHLSNIADHRAPNAEAMILHDYESMRAAWILRDDEPMRAAWNDHLAWINANVVGPPAATDRHTREELEAMGVIGIYAPTLAQSGVEKTSKKESNS